MDALVSKTDVRRLENTRIQDSQRLFFSVRPCQVKRLDQAYSMCAG